MGRGFKSLLRYQPFQALVDRLAFLSLVSGIHVSSGTLLQITNKRRAQGMPNGGLGNETSGLSPERANKRSIRQ